MESEIINAYNMKKYGKCINLLQSDINKLFTERVKVIYKDYKYTTILDIYEIRNKVFDKKTLMILEVYFRLIHDEECDKVSKIKELISIRSELNK